MDWLAWRWLAKYYSPPSSLRKQNGFPFQIKLLLTSKVTLWSACVVYTNLKTIIHLSVGESSGYLPQLYRWIIVKYGWIKQWKHEQTNKEMRWDEMRTEFGGTCACKLCSRRITVRFSEFCCVVSFVTKE